ncbi:hypothetical protein EGR_09784 [Echinococcus granulosus]|uniref:Uncharacterized protein n=1 Tax=Echinococcus granulosus TaxID=6210 RepID=W6UA43_ECHGR|nr:hypothetical protein EGR_09784 [Echinococcus granulosus]EUB55347.1 hypothetical protein EGR_09784 [Echinococcus granulosus]
MQFFAQNDPNSLKINNVYFLLALLYFLPTFSFLSLTSGLLQMLTIFICTSYHYGDALNCLIHAMLCFCRCTNRRILKITP